ncbi:MAG: TolC family protein [Proteiniphilum sp.]|uniref:TolC family protein n=1 Tax=Proteiniphilum sp. TaxID=1926877 RepID=UPI002B21D83A|nr:TolC family protein [Proteiniphilum sp.]MEA5128726.1 TolC family protein [Proteiniphilum sp.]
MRRIPLPIFVGFTLIFFTSPIVAQEWTVLRYTPIQIEALFLEQNLQLIAEKMNISLADAEIVQAKQWANPELSVGSVNFWGSEKQREGLVMGAFPKNTQFSVELSQLIQTAGKRSKLVNQTKVSKEIAVEEFEDVLRGLKAELRKLVGETTYLQSYSAVLSDQQKSLEQLTEAYKKQAAQGNIAKTELVRLQSGLLELENEINETRSSLNEQQKNLKSLLNISPLNRIEIDPDNDSMPVPEPDWLASLFVTARESRPDLKRGELETLFYEKSFIYEKSLRTPDITLSANYDRYGGVWKDFVGIGISFELPFLNRNQGNIKAARISINQSRQLALQQQNNALHEIAEAFANYEQAYNFQQKIAENELLTELDKMFEIYTKNLLNKNISMLEYIDFMESYRSSKQTMLSARKNKHISFIELQYATGSDLK